MSYARKCPCGQCDDWHVQPQAAMQGVNFTQEQAELIAAFLNGNALLIPTESLEESLKLKKALSHSVQSEIYIGAQE